MVNTQEHILEPEFYLYHDWEWPVILSISHACPDYRHVCGFYQLSSEIGIIAGIFALSAIVVRLFTDALVENLGRKRCLFLGLLISLIATAGYGLFPTFGASGGAYPSWIRVRSIDDVCGGSGCEVIPPGIAVKAWSILVWAIRFPWDRHRPSAWPSFRRFRWYCRYCIGSLCRRHLLFSHCFARYPERRSCKKKKETISLSTISLKRNSRSGVISFLFRFCLCIE